MSRFSAVNNSNLFLKKKSKSVSVLPIVENVIVENVIEEIIIEEPQAIPDEIINVEITSEPIQEVQEINIPIEEIYHENKEEEVKEEINPIQTEMKKRKSKEKFRLLVEEIILNRKKELIDGWV